MSEGAPNLSQFEGAANPHIRWRTRLIVYLAVWLLAAVAIQILARPQGLTETDVSSLKQRLQWPLLTPVVVWLGSRLALKELFGWSAGGTWTPLFSFAYFVAQAVFALTPRRRLALVLITCLQAVVVAISLAYFFRETRLPSGE